MKIRIICTGSYVLESKHSDTCWVGQYPFHCWICPSLFPFQSWKGSSFFQEALISTTVKNFIHKWSPQSSARSIENDFFSFSNQLLSLQHCQEDTTGQTTKILHSRAEWAENEQWNSSLASLEPWSCSAFWIFICRDTHNILQQTMLKQAKKICP